MYVLGIETSCDETAASVVRDGRDIISNIVSSSLRFHQRYGGIVPEIAFRKQLEAIESVSGCALEEAGLKLRDIKLVSVTSGPGLLGSLLVGVSFAKAISLGAGIPLIGLNHLHSHIYASFLNGSTVKLPCIALVVSGGHTTLFHVRDFDRIEIIGSTSDDACGEAFDKVAKILGLGYPGGPAIERLAGKGNPNKMRFKCSGTERPLDFSFSGIKTAVLYYVRRTAYGVPRKGKTFNPLPLPVIQDIAASFQEVVINTLVHKAFLACQKKKVPRLVIGGGVVANDKLRAAFLHRAAAEGVKIYFPAKPLCMDNAAMVAGLGYQLFKIGLRCGLRLNVNLN